eukprot:5702921-Pyramimonas_sp.AAC.1
MAEESDDGEEKQCPRRWENAISHTSRDTLGAGKVAASVLLGVSGCRTTTFCNPSRARGVPKGVGCCFFRSSGASQEPIGTVGRELLEAFQEP